MNQDLIFYQLFESESSTYTYILGDPKTKEALIIDPVLETVERDLKLIGELGLHLLYILDTHVHADHITGAGEIRKHTHAKSCLSHLSKVPCIDLPLKDGQELTFGSHKVRALATPGHTDACMSYYIDGMVFTGDSLMVRGNGRTDFQQGSAEKLFESIRNKLFLLPDETKVYPGHDYRGQTSSSIGLEKKFNSRISLSQSKQDFVKTMAELKLAHPKKIHEALPANMSCGLKKTERVFQAQNVDGVPEITVESLFSKLQSTQNGKVLLLDVRREEEFNNELGHIEGARLVTLGPELTSLLESGDRKQEIVFICRSGQRSANATLQSIELGYQQTVNMSGGMIRWNANNFPTEKL